MLNLIARKIQLLEKENMKIIKYIFALILITNYSKVVGMEFDKIRWYQIQEAGKTANIKMAQELLDSGVNVNVQGALGYSMLLHAISYLHETKDNKIPQETRLEFIEFLIQQGADLNPKTDRWTEVPMLIASSSNIGPEIIALFIKYGADVNITHFGISALHLAALNGHLDTVNFLLNQKNIKINVTDKAGRTPLIEAVFGGYTKVVEMLLKHGADITIKDCSERTALDHAISSSFEDGEWRDKWQTIKILLNYDHDNIELKKIIRNYKFNAIKVLK